MKESRGQIQIEFQAELPSGGPNRRLTLENLHLSGIAALPGELSRPVRSRYSRCRAKTKRFAVDLPIGLRAGRCSFRFVFAWGPADRVSLCTIALVLLARFALLLWRPRARGARKLSSCFSAALTVREVSMQSEAGFVRSAAWRNNRGQRSCRRLTAC